MSRYVFGKPTKTERIIGGICYLTFGIAGIIYIVLSGRSSQSSFFRFHFLQSIILGIIGFLFSWASGAFASLAGGMFGLIGSMLPQAAPQIVYWFSFAITIIVRAFMLLPLYGMIWSFWGKYAEIPFISNVVRQQL